MSDTNVAQDQIKAFVDRILRMKDEADAIGADIKEIYAEAKENGFDKTQLGNLVTYLRKKDKDAEGVAEGEVIFDLYLTAYMGASGKVGTKPATHTHASEKPDPIAALRADPTMAIVEPANLKKNTETQPAPQAGSDLTETSQAPGQVAQIPAVVEGQSSALGADVGGSGDAQFRDPNDWEDEDGAKPVSADTGKAASKYAAPGEIIWETHPPEGVERGAISMAFGTMGQDTAVIADELERGAAQPIVKKGRVILDGWARFMAARQMTELDGSPMAYPVVQYDGSDILVDIIKLNVDGRILNDDQKRKIAASLARQEPNRKDDIYKAFELWMEPA